MFDTLDCDIPEPGWYVVDTALALLAGPYRSARAALDATDDMTEPFDGIMRVRQD